MPSPPSTRPNGPRERRSSAFDRERAHLSPLRRGYVIGFMRARRKARVELRALAADYDAELVDLLRELGEIRDEYHTRLLTDAAVYERKQMGPGTLLH